MKKDALEDFIREQREPLSPREPSQRVWRSIESALWQRKGLWHSLNVWRAAAAIFFALSAWLLVAKPTPVANPEQARLQGEFRDVESFYKQQIAEKVALIEHFDTDDDDQFAQDLQKLDAMYQVLLEEMRRKPSQQVKDALVLNLLVRVDLLNQQIQKLEETKQAPKDSVSI
jgi:hypothetical protein